MCGFEPIIENRQTARTVEQRGGVSLDRWIGQLEVAGPDPFNTLISRTWKSEIVE